MPVSMKIVPQLAVSATTLPVLFHGRKWKLPCGNCKRSANHPMELSHLHPSYGDLSGHFIQISGCFHKVFCGETHSHSPHIPSFSEGYSALPICQLFLQIAAWVPVQRHCQYFIFHNAVCINMKLNSHDEVHQTMSTCATSSIVWY